MPPCCWNTERKLSTNAPFARMNSLLHYRRHVVDSNKNFRRGLSAQEVLRRSDGEFFATLEILCRMEDMNLASSIFPQIRRTEGQGARIYPRSANLEYIDNLSEAETASSDATNTQQINTCVDFLFNLETEKAHLLSNARLCHVAYVRFVQAVTGVFMEDYSKRRKLLNGMKMRTRRMDDSGVKHSKFNKLYLKMQRNYLDSTPPALIVIPIMSLDEIKAWDGVQPYSALVLPCGERGPIAAADVLQNVRDSCSEQDVRTGLTVLRTFLKDIAESLIDTDHDVLADFNIVARDTTDSSAVRWKNLVRELRSAAHPSIRVPTLRAGINFQTTKIAKGTFDVYTSCLPDPHLLALKGAINFSSHAGAKLMPACTLKARLDSYDSESDL